MTIHTPEDWWNLVDKYWTQLVDIMCKYLPMDDPTHVEPGVADSPLLMSSTTMTVTGYQDVIASKESRDHYRLLRYFNGAWRMAPDDRSIHSIPGWGVLCDLCSEDWVFNSEGEKDYG